MAVHSIIVSLGPYFVTKACATCPFLVTPDIGLRISVVTDRQINSRMIAHTYILSASNALRLTVIYQVIGNIVFV